MRPWPIILLLIALTSGGKIYRPSRPPPIKHQLSSIPLQYFWGIAREESGFDPLAIGEDGFDHGLWQFRVFYNAERGLDNPFDPVESTEKAIANWNKNYRALGTIDRAITAHRRGLAWTRKHGIDREYVRKVRGK